MARPLYWEPVWSKIKTVGKTGVIPSGQKIETAAKTGSCPVAVYPCRMTSATLSEARNCAHRESTGQGGETYGLGVHPGIRHRDGGPGAAGAERISGRRATATVQYHNWYSRWIAYRRVMQFELARGPNTCDASGRPVVEFRAGHGPPSCSPLGH